MTIGVNDYQYAGRCPGACSVQCAGAAPCGGQLACCQCVSFIVQRVCRDLGVQIGAWGFGDARTWPSVAQAHGVRVDGTPGVHSVLVLPPGVNGAGSVGHVAFVLEVGPSAHAPAGFVFVEDYDYNTGSGPCRYAQHTIRTAGSVFLHFRDAGAVPLCLPACDSCHNCVSGQCVPLTCPSGYACVNGQCVHGGPTPPPPPLQDVLVPFALVAAGVGGIWLYQRGRPRRSEAFGRATRRERSGRGFGRSRERRHDHTEGTPLNAAKVDEVRRFVAASRKLGTYRDPEAIVTVADRDGEYTLRCSTLDGLVHAWDRLQAMEGRRE